MKKKKEINKVFKLFVLFSFVIRGEIREDDDRCKSPDNSSTADKRVIQNKRISEISHPYLKIE